ncbi:MAG: type II toxin-antitoxin system PemK/MazF family toxin [Phycisphaerae bacterium]|nr:type II toxin-antitoxin system PemK/MazF family toxin [Phycisphaerae bacterium]
MPERPVRQGAIFWLDDCPPLEGDRQKRRPVVVVDAPEVLRRNQSDVLVVAISSTAMNADRVRLPTRDREPRATTGLARPSWVVPGWYLAVQRDRLRDRAGHVSGALLRRIVGAVMAAMERDEGA